MISQIEWHTSLVLFFLFLAYSSIIYMRLEKKLKERKLSNVFPCESMKALKEVSFFRRRIVYREQHAAAIATVAYCCIRIHGSLYFRNSRAMLSSTGIRLQVAKRSDSA
jgi:hypothetical protein